MTNYKAEGITSVNLNAVRCKNNVTKSGSVTKSTNLIDYSFVPFNKSAIYINSDTEFKNNIYNIVNNFYLSIYVTGNVLHLATENGDYYVVYTDKVAQKNVEFILNNRFVKKVFFDKKNINDILLLDNMGSIDLKFISKILFLKDFNSEEEMFLYFGVPVQKIKPISVKIYNFIEIAKKINIYVEKNKLNRYLYLENDVKNILDESRDRGFPINVEKYEEYIQQLEDDYKNTKSNNLDFNNKNILLENLNKRNKYMSLHPEILIIEDEELYNNLAIVNRFNMYKKNEKVNIGDSVLYIEYDTYNIHTFCIKESFVPNYFYYDKNISIVEGSYSDIYFKILAELSRNNDLILEASKGTLLDYISKAIGMKAKDNSPSIMISMFLNAYANNRYDERGITNHLYHYWDTYISSNDVKNMNKLFYAKMPELMSFFKTFDGNDTDYARYNTKIFHPHLNLHQFILQIENLIYKTSIKYIYKAITDYNEKYEKNAILFGGVFEKKIILLANREHSDVAIDILNRYMAVAYRRYIKKTKYFNATEIKKK